MINLSTLKNADCLAFAVFFLSLGRLSGIMLGNGGLNTSQCDIYMNLTTERMKTRPPSAKVGPTPSIYYNLMARITWKKEATKE